MAGGLIVFGASGHGKVVADAARNAGWDLVGWADDDPSKRSQVIAGLPVVAIGVDEVRRLASQGSHAVVVAIGDNRVRRRLFVELVAAGVDLATVVHPAAVVSASAVLGPGTVIFAGAVVNADARIGDNVIINTSATVDHDNQIGDHVHISPGAHLGGMVEVGEGTHVGIGVAVRNNLSIGSWSLVGAGSVVVSEIGSSVVAYGVPAKVIRKHTV